MRCELCALEIEAGKFCGKTCQKEADKIRLRELAWEKQKLEYAQRHEARLYEIYAEGIR